MFSVKSSLLVGCLLAALLPGQAAACRCREPGPRQAWARADAVALVRVGESTALEGDAVQTQAEVLQSWKGAPPHAVRIVTGEDCAYPLRPGEVHVLYLSRGNAPDEYGTYACRGNAGPAQATARRRWLDRHPAGR